MYTTSTGSFVTCSACGTTLNDSEFASLQKRVASHAHGADLCPMCRVTRHLLSRMPPLDTCPMCESTRVVRSRMPSNAGDELLFCPHCDHMWSRPLERDDRRI